MAAVLMQRVIAHWQKRSVLMQRVADVRLLVIIHTQKDATMELQKL